MPRHNYRQYKLFAQAAQVIPQKCIRIARLEPLGGVGSGLVLRRSGVERTHDARRISLQGPSGLRCLGVQLVVARVLLRHGRLVAREIRLIRGDIQRADEAIIPMDELIAARINDGVDKGDAEAIATDWEALQPQIDQALVDLDAARRDVEAVQSKLVDARDKEAANRALVAANARVNMIGAGRELMAEAVPARRAQQAAQTAWEKTLEGDGLARDAAAALSSMTKDTVNQSMALSEQALAAFTAARDGLESAAELYPNADYTAFVSYLNLRIDAQYAAIQ